LKFDKKIKAFEILKKYKQSMFGIKNMFGVMR